MTLDRRGIALTFLAFARRPASGIRSRQPSVLLETTAPLLETTRAKERVLTAADRIA